MDAPSIEITEVSNYGEVTATFDQKMVILTEEQFGSLYDTDAFSLTVYTENDLFDPEEILLKWNVTEFTQDYMKI